MHAQDRAACLATFLAETVSALYLIAGGWRTTSSVLSMCQREQAFFFEAHNIIPFFFLAQGHGGESPDSMPIAWHNPITNKTSYVHALMFEFLSGRSNGSRRCYGGSGLLSQWFESILL